MSLSPSEWNNGIAFDFKDECRKGNVGNALLYSLSVSRHVIYILDHDGALSVVSLREPTCTFVVSEARAEYADGKVVHLHVTNSAKDTEDRLMVSLNESSQIHVLSMTGEHQYTHNLTEGDQVVAVKSNIHKNIFIAVHRSSSAVVLMYPNGLNKGNLVELFSLPNSQIVSFSASSKVAAILVRDQQMSTNGSSSANGTMPSTNSNFTLVIRTIEGKKAKEVWYRCLNATDLKGMTIVDESDRPVVKNICDDKEEICSSNVKTECDAKKVLQFKILSPLVNPKSVEREATTKLYMMISLSMLTLLSLIFLQFTTSLT